jgi:excinuclease ABC subunit C
MLQRIRDEAHRFAIGYYRKKHESGGLRSSLDEISGIGPKTKKLLLKEFGSVKAIRAASLSELGKVVGQDKARRLRTIFGE